MKNRKYFRFFTFIDEIQNASYNTYNHERKAVSMDYEKLVRMKETLKEQRCHIPSEALRSF